MWYVVIKLTIAFIFGYVIGLGYNVMFEFSWVTFLLTCALVWALVSWLSPIYDRIAVSWGFTPPWSKKS